MQNPSDALSTLSRSIPLVIVIISADAFSPASQSRSWPAFTFGILAEFGLADLVQIKS